MGVVAPGEKKMNSNYFKINSIKLTRAMGIRKTWGYCSFTNNHIHTGT